MTVSYEVCMYVVPYVSWEGAAKLSFWFLFQIPPTFFGSHLAQLKQWHYHPPICVVRNLTVSLSISFPHDPHGVHQERLLWFYSKYKSKF